ncbi:MAG: hypothetical protein M5U19_14400 [Microthrixaceae bacterium]|nr:hypothetical protein [Microthrixaceae bacterium]
MKTYPGMDFAQFVRWAAFSGIKRVRPLYWLDYDKEATKRFLSDTYGWEWYGGHHLENRFTAFYHSYFLPRRWGIDMRILGYSGMVRSRQLTRAEAEAEMAKPPHLDDEVLDLVKKRLGFDADEFDRVMALPKHHYSEFRTYKRRFELLRPFFWALYKMDRVPKSFYVKFCQRSPVVGRDR